MAVNVMLELKPDDGWVQGTTGDATAITAIHRGGGGVAIMQAIVGANAPATTDIRGAPIEKGKDGHPSGFLKKFLTELTHTASPTLVYFRALKAPVTLWIETD